MNKIIKFTFLILFLLGFIFTLWFAPHKYAQNRIILIGIDGATWKVIWPLVREGKLPHMGKLIEKGSWGVLLSEEPMLSPALWTTIATGKSREEHGIISMEKKEASKFHYSCYSSLDRKTKALWDILTDYGLSAGVINWWATWPAEKINGYMVSDFFQLQHARNREFPEGENVDFSIAHTTYPESIFNLIQKYLKIKIIPEEFSLTGQKGLSVTDAMSFINSAKEEDINIEEIRKGLLINRIKIFPLSDMRTFLIGKQLFKKLPVDLCAIYLTGIDYAQHSFWEFFEPHAPKCNFHPTQEEIDLFGQIIPKYYEWYDKLIGELLVSADKGNITVIMVSDHGSASSPEPLPYFDVNLNFVFEKIGWLKMIGKESYSKDSIVYQPTGFRSSYKSICLNLKGREPNGIIKIEDYEDVRRKIRDGLLVLETQDGKKLFKDITLVKEPRIENTDLKAKINPLIYPEDKILINGEGVAFKRLMLPSLWSGDHDLKDGIIIMSGKNIKRGQIISGATIYDIAPTILALLGIPIGKDMDGKVLTDCIEEGYFIKKPIRYINSHGWYLKAGRKTNGKPLFDAEMEERLRSIGYLQ